MTTPGVRHGNNIRQPQRVTERRREEREKKRRTRRMTEVECKKEGEGGG